MKNQFFLLFLPFSVLAQYEPQVSEPGSTAISKDSNVFVAWAKSGTAFPGYKDIAKPASGRASVGTIESALGKAGSSGVLSLGDGGAAIFTFDKPVKNGKGADFAVFENGFREMSTKKDYMEFAFVEVSSDGNNFFRFLPDYMGDTLTQVSSFQATDTKEYHNLAGKYWSGYGTPFDLEELKGIAGLDVNNVTHIKIIDVVGTINPLFASRDGKGRKINDPYPTDFASGGFDLDAVGVIHQADPLGLSFENRISKINIYPNPASDYVSISKVETSVTGVFVSDLNGVRILEWAKGYDKMDISKLSAGIYIIEVQTGGSNHIERLTKN